MTRGNYRTERLKIAARDGTDGAGVDRLSGGLRARTGSRRCSSTPMAPTAMRSRRASRPGGCRLLDRGFAYAIAHIRGGDDLGQQWYHDGKLEKRTNTFNDFVDVARGLIAQRLDQRGPDRDRGRDRRAAS